MLAAERRQIIAERLQAAGRVMVGELSGEFSVSEETIRRDLEWLESEGAAKRTHGGAVPLRRGKRRLRPTPSGKTPIRRESWPLPSWPPGWWRRGTR